MAALQPMEGFLDLLREQGFSVGVDSYLRVQALLDRLDPGTPGAELRTLMCPLFARSPAEQQKFYRLFDGYFHPVFEGGHLHVPAPPPRPAARPLRARLRKPVRKVRTWLVNRWLFGTMALLASVLLVYTAVEVYVAFKGNQERPGAVAYLSRYGLDDDPKYRQLVLRYIGNELLGRPQPCDDLSEIRILPAITETEGGRFLVRFRTEVRDSISTRTWYFGSGQDSSQVHAPEYVYRDTGSYQVVLRIRNAAGCQASARLRLQLTRAQSCQAAFSYAADAANPLKVAFADTSLAAADDPIVSRTWSFGDDEGSTSQELAPSFAYPGYRAYKVCLSIRTRSGCASQVCQVIRLSGDTDRSQLIALNPGPMAPADLSPLRSRFTLFSPYAALLAGCILLIIGFFYETYAFFRRRLLLSRERGSEGPLTWSFRLRQPPRVIPREQVHRAANHLRQRQESEQRLLDLPGTIAATAESGGFPAFVYRAGTKPSEYLVLIEQQSRNDHQAQWFYQLVSEMAGQDVFVDVCFTPPDFSVFHRPNDDRPMLLAELRARFPDHRLLMFGEGRSLLDAMSGRLLPLAYELLGWRDCALLTPRPRADWQAEEAILSRHLPVLPARIASLDGLLAWFGPDAPRTAAPPLRGGPGAGWDEELPEQADALRELLGEPLYAWVAACALYPELQWPLTLAIGRQLELAGAGTLLDEDTVLRLSRLRWFREGAMPDSLRAQLAESLPPARTRAAREAIAQMLEAHPQPEDSFAAERRRLHLAVQNWHLSQNPNAREALREYAERGDIDDALVMRQLRDSAAAPLAARIPPGIRSMLFRKGIGLLGMKPWIRIAAGGTVALLMLFSQFRQHIHLTDYPKLERWIHSRGNLIKVDGEYYRLRNRADSARYFSYLGVRNFRSGDLGSAYNLFSDAAALDPFNPLYRYQRGLTNLRFARAEGADSLREATYRDFAFADAAAPWIGGTGTVRKIAGFRLPELRDAKMLPDGSRLYYAADSTVTELSLQDTTASPGRRFRCAGRVQAFDVSADGRFLAAASGSRIWLWELGSGELLGELARHTRVVNALCFSPDAAYLASGGEDQIAIIWNRQTRSPIHLLEFLHTAPVLDLVFSPDNQYVATGSADSTAVVWDRSTGQFVSELNGLGQPVRLVRFLPDSRTLLTGSGLGNILIWSFEGEVLDSLRVSGGRAGAFGASPDGSMIAAPGSEGYALHTLSGSRVLAGIPAPPDAIAVSFSYTADGARMLMPESGAGAGFYALEGARFDSLKYHILYQKALLSYELGRFEEAAGGYSRLIGLRPQYLPAWYGRGIARLYQAGKIPYAENQLEWAGTSYLLSGLKDLDYALRGDSSLRRQLPQVLPLIFSLYNGRPALNAYRDSVCAFLERYQQGACGVFTFDQIEAYSEGLAAVRRGTLWGYIDTLQRLAIPLQYQHPSAFMNGLAAVFDPKAAQYVIIDPAGAVMYDRVEAPSEGFRAVREASSGLWGYLDAANRLAIPAQYAEVRSFRKGQAQVRVKRGTPWMEIDYNGASPEMRMTQMPEMMPAPSNAPQAEPLILPDGSVTVPMGPPADGLIRARNGALYGYVAAQQASPAKGGDQLQQETVISFQYADAYDFSFQRAAVKRQDGLWGFIDPYGKAVIPFEYEQVGMFAQEDGRPLARVSRQGQQYYIDRSGACVPYKDLSCPVMRLQTVSREKSFADPGSSLVVYRENGKWGLKREDGTVVIQPVYANQILFSNGLACVQLNGRWGYIDRTGAVVVPLAYDDGQPFSDGLAAVKMNGKWGYIDTQGKLVIGYQYDGVRPFVRGKAIVRIGKKSYRIDKQGNIVGASEGAVMQQSY